MDSIKGFSGPGVLGKAEKFYLQISGIPRLTERLAVHEIGFRWPREADRLSVNVRTFISACKEFDNPSVQFIFILLYTLSNLF